MAQLQAADDNYYIFSKHVLELTNKAYELFIGFKVDEKRQLLKFLLQNLRLDGKNIVYNVQKPFNLIVESSERQAWCSLLNAFREHEALPEFSLQSIQTIFRTYSLKI